jgi:hypothetical protein
VTLASPIRSVCVCVCVCAWRAHVRARVHVCVCGCVRVGLCVGVCGAQSSECRRCCCWQALKVALAADPSHVEAQNNLAVLELKKGNIELARGGFREAHRCAQKQSTLYLIHTHTHTHTHTHPRMYVCVLCVCTYVRIYTYIHIYVYIYVCTRCAHAVAHHAHGRAGWARTHSSRPTTRRCCPTSWVTSRRVSTKRPKHSNAIPTMPTPRSSYRHSERNSLERWDPRSR